jgi:hypothetical protein
MFVLRPCCDDAATMQIYPIWDALLVNSAQTVPVAAAAASTTSATTLPASPPASSSSSSSSLPQFLALAIMRQLRKALLPLDFNQVSVTRCGHNATSLLMMLSHRASCCFQIYLSSISSSAWSTRRSCSSVLRVQ